MGCRDRQLYGQFPVWVSPWEMIKGIDLTGRGNSGDPGYSLFLLDQWKGGAMKDLGQTAYEAYADAVGGVNVRDEPLPDWSELGESVRAGWAAAALAVADVSRETEERS